jgi:hypothetical protein
MREYGLAALDQRTAEAKNIASWRERLVHDLGGPENISTQQATLIDLAARQKVLIDGIDNWLFSKPEERVFRRRDRSLYPIISERQSLVNALARFMAQLGFDKHVPKGRDLSDWEPAVVEDDSE